MSFVYIIPETLTAAADNLHHVATVVNAANTLATVPISGVTPAAADEVSALTAAQFAAHAHVYHAVSAHAAALHQAFVAVLGASAGCYADTEAINAASAG